MQGRQWLGRWLGGGATGVVSNSVVLMSTGKVGVPDSPAAVREPSLLLAASRDGFKEELGIQTEFGYKAAPPLEWYIGVGHR